MTVGAGDPVPDFGMSTDDGGTISRESLLGRTTVLYFYPRDDTPGCTTEAKGFRDALPEFAAAGVAVVGVSADSLQSHGKFRAKHDLNFALASDTDAGFAKTMGVWVEKSMYGKKYMGLERSTFLVDRQGVIRRIWRKVKVTGHVSEVLKAARELSGA